MAASLETRPSLLLRLREPADQEAWRQFVDAYGPMVYRYARQRGLQDADAADLTQIVLLQVSGSVRRFDYDPRRGSFRGWLFGLVRHQLGRFQSAERRHHEHRSPAEMLREVADASDPSAEELMLWEREFEQQLFLRAAEQVKGQVAETTWDAFWRTAVNDQDPRQAAEALGVSVGTVYTAKSRMIERLRQVIRELRDEWNPA